MIRILRMTGNSYFNKLAKLQDAMKGKPEPKSKGLIILQGFKIMQPPSVNYKFSIEGKVHKGAWQLQKVYKDVGDARTIQTLVKRNKITDINQEIVRQSLKVSADIFAYQQLVH